MVSYDSSGIYWQLSIARTEKVIAEVTEALAEFRAMLVALGESRGGAMNEFQQEAKSSVSATTNAKGEVQVGVKAYDGVTQEEMDRLGAVAVAALVHARELAVESGLVIA